MSVRLNSFRASRVAALMIMGAFVICAQAGEAVREPGRDRHEVMARIAKLRAEIAALDAQARGDSPEFEAELREWEARMAEPAEWSAHKKSPRPVPEKVRRILALEPSERTPVQRATLVQYFRPESKTVAQAQRTAAAKRAELAALRRTAR